MYSNFVHFYILSVSFSMYITYMCLFHSFPPGKSLKIVLCDIKLWKSFPFFVLNWIEMHLRFWRFLFVLRKIISTSVHFQHLSILPKWFNISLYLCKYLMEFSVCWKLVVYWFYLQFILTDCLDPYK